MKTIAVMRDKAAKPVRLLLTLLHFLTMRTWDVFTGVPRDRVRTALAVAGRRAEKPPRVRLRRRRCLENPLDCAACMQACPEGVFFTYPKDRRRGAVCNSYDLVAAFRSRCRGCGLCVEKCPHDALRLA
jgi:formate hydrogenlyase subunit 6/NADH:ubiquinone oxidoreductase subunit I